MSAETTSTEQHTPQQTDHSTTTANHTTSTSTTAATAHDHTQPAHSSPPTHVRPIVHSTAKLDNDIDGPKTEEIQDPQKLLAQRFARMGINKHPEQKQEAKKDESSGEEEDDDDEDEDGDNGDGETKTKKNQRDILLVEDVRVSQRVARVALMRAKYRVDTVDTGAEALKKVARKKYGMILMDINLGEAQMDGCETTSKIREYERAHHRPRCVIFGLTGSVSKEDIEKYRQHELDGVIAKGNVLISAVQEALDHHNKNPNEFVISRLEVAKK